MSFSAPPNRWADIILSPLTWILELGTERPGFIMVNYSPEKSVSRAKSLWEGDFSGDAILGYTGCWSGTLRFDIHFYCVASSMDPDILPYLITLHDASLPDDRHRALERLVHSRYERARGDLLPRDRHPVSTQAGRAEAAVWSKSCEVQFPAAEQSCLVGLFSAFSLSPHEVLLIYAPIDLYWGAFPAAARTMARAFDAVVDSVQLGADACSSISGSSEPPR